MKYYIRDALVGGVINPTLIISGWVESKANDMVIMSNGKEICRKKIKKLNSSFSDFIFFVDVSKNNKVIDVYFESNEEKVFVVKVQNSPIKRLLHRLNFSYGLKNLFSKQRRYTRNNYRDTLSMYNEKEYNLWLKKNESFLPVYDYEYQPKISIVMPVYNVPGKYLSYCIESILNQTYQNFEICIADDCSTNQDTIDTLNYYIKKDNRIKVVFREKNGHISRATNSALEIATGEFVGLMDNDDKLDIHALNEIVYVLNQNKEIDFIYTDEDKIDMEENRSNPHFKPDFSLETLYGGNYICHFSVIRKKSIDIIGGFRVGYEGSQDFDLFLRLTTITDKFYHIPKILYHWRMIPGSTAVGGDGAKNYAGLAGERALQDYLDSSNLQGKAYNHISTNYYVDFVTDNELVEIIIISKGINKLNSFIKEIKYSMYDNFHISAILNSKKNVEINGVSLYCVNEHETVNNINKIVRETNCKYVLLVKDSCFVQRPDFLNLLTGYARQSTVGMVSGKFLDKHNLVAEAGMVLSKKNGLSRVFTNYMFNAYGDYGRMLFPCIYSVVSSELVCFEKKKFIALDNSFNYDFSVYDLCLNLSNKGYHNIVIPQLEIINNSFEDKFDKNNMNIFKMKHKADLYYDQYYNINLSTESLFRLNKKRGG